MLPVLPELRGPHMCPSQPDFALSAFSFILLTFDSPQIPHGFSSISPGESTLPAPGGWSTRRDDTLFAPIFPTPSLADLIHTHSFGQSAPISPPPAELPLFPTRQRGLMAPAQHSPACGPVPLSGMGTTPSRGRCQAPGATGAPRSLSFRVRPALCPAVSGAWDLCSGSGPGPPPPWGSGDVQPEPEMLSPPPFVHHFQLSSPCHGSLFWFHQLAQSPWDGA